MPLQSTPDCFKEYHTRAAKEAARIDHGGWIVDTMLQAIASVGDIFASIAAIQGAENAVGNNISEAANTARGVVGFGRTVYTLHNIFSGRICYDYENRKWKSLSDIAIGVMYSVGRIFGSINFLHKMDLYDLGKASKTVGQISCVAYIMTITSCAANAGVDLYETATQDWEEFTKKDGSKKFENEDQYTWHVKTKIADLVRSGCDMISMPGDFGLFKEHPIGALVTSCLSLLSAMVWLTVEMFFTADAPKASANA